MRNGRTDRPVSLHCLHHAAASLFIEQGWSPKKIQTILGHSSITMTFDVYGHLFHDAEADVALMEKVERDLLAAKSACPFKLSGASGPVVAPPSSRTRRGGPRC